jgi:Lysyl oxidase
MQADQLIETVADARKRVPNIGWIRYVVSPGHRHWHYLEFDRYELQSYELRRYVGGEAAVRDRKTGFCLGDRYRVGGLRLVDRAVEPVFTGYCGLSKPGLLHVREGISVGYGDDYSAFLEGQSLPLDGLPDGRYLLIHRVNEAGVLQELSQANNAASVLLALHWREGKPHIQVLARCPNSASCSPRQ